MPSVEAHSTSRMVGDHAAEDQNLIWTSNMWISPFEVLLLWLLNTVYHLLVKNDRREGGGGGAYLIYSPEKVGLI